MSLSSSEWVKGIGLSVLGSMIGGASKLAIRKSFLMEESLSEKDDDNNAPTRHTARWLRWTGMMGMLTLNPLCGVMAMNYASPSITAPFSGLTLVWIVAFSNILIGETASWRQQVAAALIVLGEVVIAIFGDHTNDDDVTLSELEQSYRNPAFVAFLLIMVLWMGMIAFWIHHETTEFIKRFAWGVAGGSVTGLVNFL